MYFQYDIIPHKEVLLVEETKKRVRRSKDEVVADKIAKLDADITKY